MEANHSSRTQLPPIPAKRYFTIGEVSELCGVKPHVLRYWEQEFTQLKPVKRRGNRRYYQHHEVLLIRRIRELLYDQGFTISGARNRLDELVSEPAAKPGRAQSSRPNLAAVLRRKFRASSKSCAARLPRRGRIDVILAAARARFTDIIRRLGA
jgi:DNA-binding transcriptional MerR regulator